MLKHLIDRPVAVSMALLALLVLGVAGSRLLPVSLIPESDIPVITVQVDAPRLPARTVDESIIAPLRQRLIQVGGLADITGEARDGGGCLRLTFSHGTRIDYAFIEVNEKIDRAMGSLPKIERPRVIKASASDIPAFYIDLTLKDSVATQQSFAELSRFAREVITSRFEQLEAVAMADISGFVSNRVQVVPYIRALAALGLTPDAFERIVSSGDIRLGSLSIRDGQYRYNVKFSGQASTLDDIRNTWFSIGDRLLQVKDVASVEEVPAPRTGLVRSEGRPSVCLAIVKQADARMVELKKAAGDLIVQMEEDYPQITFRIVRDQTRLLSFSIRNLLQSILMAVLLTCVVVFLFMRDFRSPALVCMVLPVSLVLSMLAFYATGLSLNIISLSGLLLGVGMMADNTIILVDNITARWRRDGDLREAVLLGTREVSGAMLSAILTTCAVFVPLVFAGGTAGLLFRDQAVAITVVLFSAYFVTLTVVPVFYWTWYRHHSSFRPHPLMEKLALDSLLQRFEHRGLSFFLRHRGIILCLLVAGMAGLVLCLWGMPRELLPPVTEEDILVHIDWNEPVTLEENVRRTAVLEKRARVEHVTSLVGTQQFLLQHSGNPGTSETTLYLLDRRDLPAVKSRLAGYLKETYPAARVQMEPSGNLFDQVFPRQGYPLTARLRPSAGERLESSSVTEILQSLQAALPQADIPYPEMRKEAVFVADPQQMALYDISWTELSDALERSLDGNPLGELVRGRQVLPVVSGLSRGTDLKTLLEDCVIEKQGYRISASALMRQTFAEDLKVLISGPEGDFVPVGLQIPSRLIPKTMETVREVVRTDGRFEVSFSGAWFENRAMTRQMTRILCIALLLLFLILAAQFESLLQPLIILSEVVIDLAFSLAVLWLFGVSVNLMSLIGLVVICGIVINDSILKIDTINRLRQAGFPLREAILEAGQRRVKAIVMTSLTTILAVCPFLVRGSMGADLQYPMSLVIVAGMTVGTLVSLFVVPVLYEIIYRGRRRS